MIIRMLKTEFGSVDGIRVAAYQVGSEYDLSATEGERDLASALVAAGIAEDVDAAPPTSKKAAKAAADPK